MGEGQSWHSFKKIGHPNKDMCLYRRPFHLSLEKGWMNHHRKSARLLFWIDLKKMEKYQSFTFDSIGYDHQSFSPCPENKQTTKTRNTYSTESFNIELIALCVMLDCEVSTLQDELYAKCRRSNLTGSRRVITWVAVGKQASLGKQRTRGAR